MPRPNRNTSSRRSRNSGITSGTTYTTLASGTTIDKTEVYSPQVRTSGATLTSSGVQNDNGYSAAYVTDSRVIATGTTSITASATTQQFTGINTIHQVLLQTSLKKSNATGYVTCVSAADAEWPSSGTTSVNIYVFDSLTGAAAGSAVSIHYTAIGTA